MEYKTFLISIVTLIGLYELNFFSSILSSRILQLFSTISNNKKHHPEMWSAREFDPNN